MKPETRVRKKRPSFHALSHLCATVRRGPLEIIVLYCAPAWRNFWRRHCFADWLPRA